MSLVLIKQTLAKHRREAWSALGVLLIVPGAAGALSTGALEAHRAEGANITVQYFSESNLHTDTVWMVTDMARRSASGRFSLRIPQDVYDYFEVSSITPAPFETRRDGSDTVYTFLSNTGTTVTFHLTPIKVGALHATVQYGVDPPVAFSVTTLP